MKKTIFTILFILLLIVETNAKESFISLEKLKNQVITGVASYVALTSAIKGALVGFRGAFGKINLILLGISAIALFRDPIQNFVAMIWEKTKEIIRGIIDYVDEQTNGLLKKNFQTPSWLQASQQQQQTSGNSIEPTIELIRGPDGTIREEPIKKPSTQPMTGQGGPNSNLPINYPQGSQQPPTQQQQQPLTAKKARYRNIHQEEPVAQPTETVMGRNIFSTRHKTCCVESPPMPQLTAFSLAS